jgi:predicted TIM-barrel fold metal-dependent hydrolase
MQSYGPIDADGHIADPADRLRPYIQEARYRRRPIYPSDGWDRSLGGKLGGSGGDGADWTRLMDEHGLEATILYPTGGLGIGCVREPDFAVSLCRAYNDFFCEEFTRNDKRLLGAALIPFQDVGEAVKELRRAVTELGMVGAMLPAVGLRLPLGDPQYHPIYAEAERLGVMVGVHATVREAASFGAALFDSFIEVHTLSHPFAQMQQLTSIVFQGVLEKFPHLRIAFMEAGCTWVPFFLDRLDTEWEMRGEIEAPACTRRPSDLVKGGNVFFHAEEDETLIPQTAAVLREDILYYATDYPHWDHHFPQSMEEFREREDIGESLRRQILHDSAARLYAFA